ncbi:MAG: hypothetical protein R3C43_07000 [Chloroflexota bacterium]
MPGYGLSCGGTDFNTTTYAYGGASGGAGLWWQPTRIVDAAGRWQHFNWLDNMRLGSTTNFVATKTYTYDSVFRWQISQAADLNGAKTQYTYDVHGRLDQVKAPNAATGNVGVVVKDYNYGDTASPFHIDVVIQAMSSNNTHTFYDAVGRPCNRDNSTSAATSTRSSPIPSMIVSAARAASRRRCPQRQKRRSTRPLIATARRVRRIPMTCWAKR